MVNRGVAPLNPSTDVGKFRLAYGDTQYTDLDPPETGYGDYTELSDAEVEGFLESGGSVPRGIGYYYLQLAGKAALTGRSVKDYDLAIDTRNRAADLRALAQYWFDLADGEDGSSEDAFMIVPTGSQGEFIPEGTVPIYGRRYEVGVWKYGV